MSVKAIVLTLAGTLLASSTSRCEGPPAFEAYPAEIQKIAEPAVDLDSHRVGREYETRITGTVAEVGVNFAGRFTIASWGCGTSCLEFVIVDLIDGKIWKPGCVAVRGIDFRPDSRLLVVDSDPPVSYAPEPTSYYLWSNGVLKPLLADDGRGTTTRCSGGDPAGYGAGDSPGQ